MRKPLIRGVRGTVQLVKLLDFAMEQANDGIAIMKFTHDADVPIRIVYANEAIERFSGFTREELLDPSNPFLRSQPQNRARYDELLSRVRSGTPVRFEIELGGKDRATWTEIRWSPLRYDDGDVTHYVAVLRDISARKRAESERDALYEAIKQAREGFSLAEVPDGDLSQRRLVYVNDTLSTMLRVPRERLLTEGMRFIFGHAPELREKCLAELALARSFESDVLVRLGDESLRWIRVVASPVLDADGRVEKLACTYHDVDERKRADERFAIFQSILSETTELIVLADAMRPSEGGPHITYANPAFAALAGVDCVELLGKPLTDFFSRGEDAADRRVILRLEHFERIEHELRVHRGTDDDEPWIELSGRPVRDERGRVTSWFFFGKDISVRRRGYMQTAQLLAALDVAEEPIAIFDVVKPLEMRLGHANERASELGTPLLEKMMAHPEQRERIATGWHALEDGRTVNRLVPDEAGEKRRWFTLELRPMSTKPDSLDALIAIQHPLRIEHSLDDAIATALALGREILRYDDHAARRDACLEALRVEWGVSTEFSSAVGEVEVVLRPKARSGYAILPPEVLFRRFAALNLVWTAPMPPPKATALRIFLETLAHPRTLDSMI